MKISVLISVYEKEKKKHLEEALDSIINQTYKADEIILVKDGPLTDELDKVIDEYKTKHNNLFKIIKLKENLGLGKALSIGIKECKNELIARADSDDICRLDRFEKQVQIFKDNEDIDIVGSVIDEYDEYMDNLISIRKVPEHNDSIIKYSRRRNPFNHMTVMYKKESVLNAGNYIDFRWNEDYYLWIRMLNRGFKGYNIQESLVYARTGMAMFERRGGFQYAKVDIKLQNQLLKMNYINKLEFLTNIVIRCVSRIIPNKLRKKIYLNILR